MHTRLRWPSLLLLLLATLAATPPARKRPAMSDAEALQALRTVLAHYQTVSAYRFEGASWNEVTRPQGRTSQRSSMQFLVQRPFRVATVVRGDEMTVRTISNGDSMWTAVEQMKQYRVQSVSELRAELDSAGLGQQFHPAGQYAAAFEGVSSVHALGRDTVITARGPVACERYAVRDNPSGDRGPGVVVHPRVLWVDPVSRWVLLDSITIDQKLPDSTTVRSVNMTRMTVAEELTTFKADAFTFRPPPDMRRVRRFMRVSPEHAAMEGRPATDFTLERLADGKSVRLSELKGKVVLLDFWATWCGPCRGWLPIVAKAQRELAGKGLVVYAVNEREPDAKVRDYLARQKLDVPVLMDRSGAVGGQYHASSIPLTIVVGRDGNVLRVMLGLHQEADLREVLSEAGLE